MQIPSGSESSDPPHLHQRRKPDDTQNFSETVNFSTSEPNDQPNEMCLDAEGGRKTQTEQMKFWNPPILNQVRTKMVTGRIFHKSEKTGVNSTQQTSYGIANRG